MPSSTPEAGSPIATGGVDGVQFWPSAVAIVGSVALILVGALPPSAAFPLALPILGFFVFIPGLSTIIALVMVTTSVRTKNWRAAVAYGVLPLAALLVFMQPLALPRLGAYAGTLIHFKLRRAEYMAEIQAMPASDEPRLKLFSWGGMFFASQGIVYDESDEVMLPAAQQSMTWRKRAEQTDLKCKDYLAAPLGQHFYKVYYPC